MYTEFYGFSERPFDVSPDPKFLHLTRGHRETLASMLYAIRERRGFMAITGEVGTGKTTLINALLNSLDDKVKTAYIFRKCVTVYELLRAILHEFGVAAKGRDRFEMWQRLDEYLLATASRDERAVLILDEAQNLSSGMLEETRTLSNLETQSAKLLQIILVGQPELDAKLNSNSLRQLRQRMVIRRRLSPLTNDEIEAYISHRLRMAGGVVYALFTPDALSLISQYSRGIPRTINIVCDNAFLVGYALRKKKIDGAIVREVITDLEGELLPSEEIIDVAVSSVVGGRARRKGGGFLGKVGARVRDLWDAPETPAGHRAFDATSRAAGTGPSGPRQGQEGG